MVSILNHEKNVKVTLVLGHIIDEILYNCITSVYFVNANSKTAVIPFTSIKENMEKECT